jgi:hypothetical protein
MLVVLLLAEIIFAGFLLGVLFVAIGVTTRHGDPTATYRLYAVRDGLIEASVFRDVSRENPWLDTLYENVNSILLHSNLVGGPSGWPLAIAVGHQQARDPDFGKTLLPLPKDPERCPEALRALGPPLLAALEHLTRNHIGIFLQMDSHEREQRCIQKEKARSLLKMMRDNPSCASACAEKQPIFYW